MSDNGTGGEVGHAAARAVVGAMAMTGMRVVVQPSRRAPLGVSARAAMLEAAELVDGLAQVGHGRAMIPGQ
jgi:acyl-CoA reductase-like NAD-dependent aldehyde dehydrogenase